MIIIKPTKEGAIINTGIIMFATILYKDENDIQIKLQQFNVTLAELKDIIHQAVSARNESVDFDPITSPGQLSYIYGTRWLRNVFCSKEWAKYRTKKNIEGVIHPENQTKIIFQNVDEACNPFRLPKPVSAKGSASEELVRLHQSQGELFSDITQLSSLNDENSSVWYFCVSVVEGEVCAELSRPNKIANGKFDNFMERIFLVKRGEWEIPNIIDFDIEEAVQEFKINVSRK